MGNKRKVVTREGANHFKVTFETPTTRLTEGGTYLFRHFDYQRHCFLLESNRHFTFENVDLFGCPGSGYQIAGKQKYWQMLACDILPEPGEGGYISSTADGVHIRQSQGFFKMINCHIARCGDDAVNLHDNVSAGIRIIDRNTLIAENVMSWRNYFGRGDILEIRNPDLTPSGFRGTIERAEFREGNECVITLVDAIPPGLDERSIVFNRSYDSSNYWIKGCTFELNRARGILVHARNGTIEDSTFGYNQMGGIRAQIDIEYRWAEGTGIDNLLIRNNHFDHVNPSGSLAGPVILFETSYPATHPGEPMLKNASIEGNTFAGVYGMTVWARGVEGLRLAGNELLSLATLEGDEHPYHSRGLVLIEAFKKH